MPPGLGKHASFIQLMVLDLLLFSLFQAFNLPKKGKLVELVDERLGSKFNKLLE
jgi:hypothetical protein